MNACHSVLSSLHDFTQIIAFNQLSLKLKYSILTDQSNMIPIYINHCVFAHFVDWCEVE